MHTCMAKIHIISLDIDYIMVIKSLNKVYICSAYVEKYI